MVVPEHKKGSRSTAVLAVAESVSRLQSWDRRRHSSEVVGTRKEREKGTTSSVKVERVSNPARGFQYPVNSQEEEEEVGRKGLATTLP